MAYVFPSRVVDNYYCSILQFSYLKLISRCSRYSCNECAQSCAVSLVVHLFKSTTVICGVGAPILQKSRWLHFVYPLFHSANHFSHVYERDTIKFVSGEFCFVLCL